MNQTKHWVQIILQHDEKAIIPFLQQLNEAQKKNLLPTLSKTAKEYLEIKDQLINHKHFYTKKASLKQERILNYSIFVCVNNPKHSLLKWLDINKLITPFTVENILNWHSPTWLSTYINSFATEKVLPSNLTYGLMLVMLKKGYFQPTKLLIARLLSRLIFPNVPKERLLFQYCPDKLGQFPITLKEHIWYIFDYPTQIHEIDRQLNFTASEISPKTYWYSAIRQYTETGQLNRLRLLKTCLETVTNPIFSNRATSWFIGLLEFLNPTEKELLNLQTELFATYENAQAKVVNNTLKHLQEIVESPDFQVANSLKNYEQLLTCSTKSIVKNGLILLEKLAENYPNYRKKITTLAVKGLVHREENIQSKAAIIISLYGLGQKKQLTKLIAPYRANLFQKTVHSLKEFKIQKHTQPIDSQFIKPKKTKILVKTNKIPNIHSLEDFKVLALIVFDNQQPYHFDQFLAALLRFQSNIKGKNIEALMPLFKRAYQLVFNELPSNQGMLDNLLAIFLMDWADLLISQYPTDSQSLRKLAETYLEQGFFIKEKNTSFDLQSAHLYGWYNPYDPSQVYMPIQKLLAKVLAFLYERTDVPLLSTPTHSPTWIDPVTFVERLILYQEKNQTPDSIDLQLAISRINFENKLAALQLANTSLEGDYLRLVQFLLGIDEKLPVPTESASRIWSSGSTKPSPTKPVDRKEISSTDKNKLAPKAISPFFYSYITAAITKNSSHFFKQQIDLPNLAIAPTYFNGAHDWMVFWEERRLEEWNYKVQRLEYTGEPFIHRELQVKFKKGLVVKQQSDFLYQYFPGNNEAFRPNVNDVQRLLGMLPNNPDPLIALLIADNLKYPTFWEAVSRKRVLEILAWLTKIHPKKYGYAAHFFLAACMLSADKAIRLSAGTIWKKAIPQRQINPVLIGEILGKMERKAFAPLKRFTDLAQTELFNLSALHNRALEEIICNLLAKLPAIPIKSTKQLLVLYRELLSINAAKITNDRLIILLELWTKSPSLKKVIRELSVFC